MNNPRSPFFLNTSDSLVKAHKPPAPLIASLFYFFYSFALIPLAWLLLAGFYFFLPKKLKIIFKLKNFILLESKKLKLDFNKPIYLVHAASGEIEYSKYLIHTLSKQNPNIQWIITYTSPSLLNLIKNLPVKHFPLALPWDNSLLTTLFLKPLKPNYVIISRTDLWFSFIKSCHDLAIPTFLIATSAPNNNKPPSFLNKMRYLYLNKIFCITSHDLNYFQSYFPWVTSIKTGDPRVDQALFRFLNPKKLPFHLNVSTHKVVTFASLWPQDEIIILKAIPLLKAIGLKLILVPHEPTQSHISFLKNWLNKNQLSFTLFSELSAHSQTSNDSHFRTFNFDTDVFLVDQVGYLAELYQFSDFSFVGGSFKKNVHSVIEPLASGNRVVFGPYHLNSPEAIYFKTKKVSDLLGFCAVEVLNEADLVSQIKNFLEVPMPKELIQKEVQALAGATAKIISELNANESALKS